MIEITEDKNMAHLLQKLTWTIFNYCLNKNSVEDAMHSVVESTYDLFQRNIQTGQLFGSTRNHHRKKWAQEPLVTLRKITWDYFRKCRIDHIMEWSKLMNCDIWSWIIKINQINFNRKWYTITTNSKSAIFKFVVLLWFPEYSIYFHDNKKWPDSYIKCMNNKTVTESQFIIR